MRSKHVFVPVDDPCQSPGRSQQVERSWRPVWISPGPLLVQKVSDFSQLSTNDPRCSVTDPKPGKQKALLTTNNKTSLKPNCLEDLIKYFLFVVLVVGTTHPTWCVYMEQCAQELKQEQGVSVLYLRLPSATSPGPAWRVTARFGCLVCSTIVFSEQEQHFHMSSCEIILIKHHIDNAGWKELASDNALSLDF